MKIFLCNEDSRYNLPPIGIDKLQIVAVAVIDSARVHLHAEGVDGVRITDPLVVHGLTDDGKLDLRASRSAVEDLVAAHRHGHHLRLEASGDHAVMSGVLEEACRRFCVAPDFDIGRHGLVGLHVEALDRVGAIDLRQEARVEGDDDGGAHEDALRVRL